jgi:hypothetical protein
VGHSGTPSTPRGAPRLPHRPRQPLGRTGACPPPQAPRGPGGWVPSEQICPQVQEVEEVREAHKAAAKCTNGSNCGNGTKYTKLRKKEQLLGTRAGIEKDSYLLPGLNQGVCKRANITLPILRMPRAVGVYLTPGERLLWQ